MTKHPSLKTIRWGIIGLGKIAHKFAKDLLTVEDAQLYAVASRSLEKANAFASEFSAKKAYGSYEDLVNDANIDAIYIATPHVLHKENSLLCLEHGKAVLCEKLSTSLSICYKRNKKRNLRQDFKNGSVFWLFQGV